MSEFTKALLIANIYRYLLIVAGTGVAYMGYRLFALGYFEKSGELKAAFGDHHFLLKQVGPGVFFAALGMLIIATAVFRGVEITVPSGIDSGGNVKMSLHREPCTDVSGKGEYYSGKDNYPEQKKKDPIEPQK